jgi:flavin-dependent dehydrogenase
VVDSCDVAVIGAGFAGAIAARDLGIAGRSVILLEAEAERPMQDQMPWGSGDDPSCAHCSLMRGQGG